MTHLSIKEEKVMDVSMKPIAIDLFSGVGGLSLGLQQAGFHVAIKVEIEEIAGRYAQFNDPLSHVLFGEQQGDVRNFSKDNPILCELLGQVGEITLIAGGPPCQGFSIAGKKNSADPLNDLVVEFARVVNELKPKAFLMENVPGITSGGSAYLKKAISDLSKNYTITCPDPLQAWDFGVPQTRKRVFMFGYRRDLGTTPSLPAPTHFFEDGKQLSIFLEKTPNAWEALSDIPNVDNFPELLSGDRILYETEPLTDFQREIRGVSKSRFDFSYPIDWDGKICTNLRRTQHGDSLLERLKPLEFGKSDKVSGIRRIDPGNLCTTIRAGTTKDRGSWSAPRPLHPFHDRVLTTRECARIQTFPDWWEFHPAKWHGNRMVGNAVPPKLAKAVGIKIMQDLKIPQQALTNDYIERDISIIEEYILKAHKSNYENRKVSQKVEFRHLSSGRSV